MTEASSLGALFATEDDFGEIVREITPLPQQIGLVLGVGLGKTEKLIAKAGDVLRAQPNDVVAMMVSDHAMATGLLKRVQAALLGIEVEVWRGADQPDPSAPGTPRRMCRRGPEVQAVMKAGGERADVCGSKRRAFCPYHPAVGGDCAYVKQTQRSGAVQFWIMPHAMLGQAAPKSLRRFTPKSEGRDRMAAVDLLIIDESFYKSMMSDTVKVPLASLNAGTWPNGVFDKNLDAAVADSRMREALLIVEELAKTAPRGLLLTRSVLMEAGLRAYDCSGAAFCALNSKTAIPRQELPGSDAIAIVAPLASHNERAIKVHRMFETMAAVLNGTLGGAALKVTDGKQRRRLEICWRKEIHADWADANLGIIHADATIRLEIVKQFLPRLVAADPTTTAAPHMNVVQITDQPMAYGKLIETKATGRGKQAARTNSARMLRVLRALAQDYPNLLVVLPKDLETQWSGQLPGNVGTLHFGKLRGQDDFRGVGALVVLSRMLPSAQAAEDMAEILFGVDVERQPPGDFYRIRPGVRLMADGTAIETRQIFHPDARVEAVRWSECEAELIQAVGRGRGVWRTADNPLDVYLLTDVALDAVPVDQTIELDDLIQELAGPTRTMVRAGILPLDWAGREALLTVAGIIKPGGMGRTGDACRKLFASQEGELDRLRLALEAAQGGARIAEIRLRSIPLLRRISAIRTPDAGASLWTPYRYRRAGARKSAVVLIDPRHTDPRVALVSAIGAVDRFASEPAASRRGRQAPDSIATSLPPAATPAPCPSPPAPATPASCAGTPSAELRATLSAVPITLPEMLRELQDAGLATAADRQRYLNRFRLMRGPIAKRERATVNLVKAELGDAVLHATLKAAARKAGVSFPFPFPGAMRPCYDEVSLGSRTMWPPVKRSSASRAGTLLTLGTAANDHIFDEPRAV